MKQHPLSALFPPMTGREYQDLVADIKEHGVRVSIVVHDDQIVDGWHRWRASQELGVECPMRHMDDEADLQQIVLSANLYRRHMTDQARNALVA